MLFDQFRIGEFAKAHSLSNAIDFFKMAMKKVSRDKAVDGISNVTESSYVYEIAFVGQI